jgi:N-acetylmuramic acid 6-phosphate etherase
MTLHETLAALTTEAVNPRTAEIDALDSRGIVGLLNAEDAGVAGAVSLVLDEVARAVDLVVDTLSVGGRLIYVGAGTSGRLGVVDASEMPPTYGTHPLMIQGVISGGPGAVFASVEGAEDDPERGAEAVLDAMGGLPAVVCGISASGRTPFVLGALEAAHKAGHPTVFLSTNHVDTVRTFAPYVDVLICPVVGPEPIAGSTRMKSGTAQKMVLNMISTATMVRLGKTYGNVMVDLQLTNTKLVERARTILMRLTGIDHESASELLAQADGHVKTALVMSAHHCSKEEARQRLARAHGMVRTAMEQTDLEGGL